jgi:hypothetical protein
MLCTRILRATISASAGHGLTRAAYGLKRGLGIASYLRPPGAPH